MRIAVFSDIHGNLPALEAVIAAADHAEVDERWCLGDVVGYGAHPAGCAQLVRERCEVALAGNHDLAVTGELDLSSFSRAARVAAEWTRQNAGRETLEFLRGLAPRAERAEVGLYHASPRDPVWEYVLSVEQAAECLAEQERRVAFVGHTHVALFFVELEPEGAREREVTGTLAPNGLDLEIGRSRWLLNPGSVGQPRDGDPRAAWVELDTDTWRVAYHRLDYDVGRAADAILRAGLPEQLARRLEVGQ